MYTRFISLFTPAYGLPHASWVPDAPLSEALAPVAVAPIEHTLRNVDKARSAMVRERDDINQQIRILAERSRQLTISEVALYHASETLHEAFTATAVIDEVVYAQGA